MRNPGLCGTFLWGGGVPLAGGCSAPSVAEKFRIIAGRRRMLLLPISGEEAVCDGRSVGGQDGRPVGVVCARVRPGAAEPRIHALVGGVAAPLDGAREPVAGERGARRRGVHAGAGGGVLWCPPAGGLYGAAHAAGAGSAAGVPPRAGRVGGVPDGTGSGKREGAATGSLPGPSGWRARPGAGRGLPVPEGGGAVLGPGPGGCRWPACAGCGSGERLLRS